MFSECLWLYFAQSLTFCEENLLDPNVGHNQTNDTPEHQNRMKIADCPPPPHGYY